MDSKVKALKELNDLFDMSERSFNKTRSELIADILSNIGIGLLVIAFMTLVVMLVMSYMSVLFVHVVGLSFLS